MIINTRVRKKFKERLIEIKQQQVGHLFYKPKFRFDDSKLYDNHFHLFSDMRFSHDILHKVAKEFKLEYIGFLLDNRDLKYTYVFKVYPSHYERSEYTYG